MKKKKLLAAFSTMAIAASMLAAMPASAANYTAVAGGTTQVQKYLVLDKDAVVPSATFNYTITAGTEKKYDGKNSLAAYAGIMPSGTTGITGTVSFAAGDTTVNGAADDGITNSTDKKYVKKAFDLDFSGVSFPEPGVYRYVLTEDNADTDNLGSGIKHVGNYQKTLDVYVKDTDGVLSVQSYVLYNSIITTAPAISNDEVLKLNNKVDRTDTTNTDKTDGFVNEYGSKSLSFAKKVEGNQGSKDKYFKFTVKIENASGANLKVVMDNAETAPTVNNATVYTAAVMAAANGIDENDTVAGQQLVIDSNEKSYDFYLNNGQYITLEGLPKGATYTVSEDAEEYTAADGATLGTAPDTNAFTDAKTGDIGDNDIKTGFTNTKNGMIPTGVILSIAGPAILGIAVVGGIVYMIIKRKKEEEQD